MNRPTCGHCGYDLTGAESSRRPECEKRLIETGVRLQPLRITKQSHRRRWWAFVLLFAISVATTFSVANSVRHQAWADLAAAKRETAQIKSKLWEVDTSIGFGAWPIPPNQVYADFQQELQSAESDMGYHGRVVHAIEELESGK